MDFHFCKSRFFGALLTIATIICLCFLLNGCSKADGNISPSSALVENGMTRQEFYSLLYKEITQDELLRSIYFPKLTTHNAVSVLCESIGEREFSEESHEALVYKAKTKNIASLEITSRVYRQGGEPEQTYWLWKSRVHKPDDYAPWSSLIADFGCVRDENKAAVALLCEVGLAKLTMNQEDFSVHLYPDEVITESEVNLLREKVSLRQRLEPSNAISTHDHNGNEIYLCFSDSISLFMFKNLLTYLSSNNEILNTFVYFDEAGTELSLWVNSVSGGMFSIPLNVAKGVACSLPYNANAAFLEQRFGIVASMLPSKMQNDVFQDFESINQGEHTYDCGENGSFKVTISVVSSDLRNVIYFKVT